MRQATEHDYEELSSLGSLKSQDSPQERAVSFIELESCTQ